MDFHSDVLILDGGLATELERRGHDISGPLWSAKLQRAVADRLLLLAADKEAAPDVRAIVELKMDGLRLRARLLAASGSVPERAHWLAIAADFTRWLERKELPTPTPAIRAPPGDPFGMER